MIMRNNVERRIIGTCKVYLSSLLFIFLLVDVLFEKKMENKENKFEKKRLT